MKQVQEQAALAEASRESSERQVRELQRCIDEIERVGVRQLKNEIRVLERKVCRHLLPGQQLKTCLYLKLHCFLKIILILWIWVR